MFLVYYAVVALFTFWAVSTHNATRGKPFVALASALVMPFTLPLIPVIGIGALVYQKLKSKALTHHAPQLSPEQKPAVEDDTTFPSWTNKNERLEEFIRTVQHLMKQKGIPLSFVVASFSNKPMFKVIFTRAGEMERQAASFTEQQIATADFLSTMWARLDADNQRKFTDIVLEPKA